MAIRGIMNKRAEGDKYIHIKNIWMNHWNRIQKFGDCVVGVLLTEI